MVCDSCIFIRGFFKYILLFLFNDLCSYLKKEWGSFVCYNRKWYGRFFFIRIGKEGIEWGVYIVLIFAGIGVVIKNGYTYIVGFV